MLRRVKNLPKGSLLAYLIFTAEGTEFRGGVATSKKCQGFMLPRMKNLPLLKRGIGNRASSGGNSLPGGGISTPNALTITCFRRNQLRLLGMGFGAACLPGRGQFVRNFGKGPGGANIVKLFHYCFYLEKRTVRVEQI